MRRQLVASGAAVTTALAVGLAISALPAVATHVEPVSKDGNLTCSDLEPEGATWTELKAQNASGDIEEDATFSDGTLTVNIINVEETDEGWVFDWTSNIGVDAVFVKGGNVGGNFYLYNPEVTGDTGLHAPLNPSDKWAGLSHISFCYDKDETTSPPPTNGETTSPPPTNGETKTPVPVPTDVPAGTNAGGSDSLGLWGLIAVSCAAVAGAAVFARRRFLHDS